MKPLEKPGVSPGVRPSVTSDPLAGSAPKSKVKANATRKGAPAAAAEGAYSVAAARLKASGAAVGDKNSAAAAGSTERLHGAVLIKDLDASAAAVFASSIGVASADLIELFKGNRDSFAKASKSLDAALEAVRSGAGSAAPQALVDAVYTELMPAYASVLRRSPDEVKREYMKEYQAPFEAIRAQVYELHALLSPLASPEARASCSALAKAPDREFQRRLYAADRFRGVTEKFYGVATPPGVEPKVFQRALDVVANRVHTAGASREGGKINVYYGTVTIFNLPSSNATDEEIDAAVKMVFKAIDPGVDIVPQRYPHRTRRLERRNVEEAWSIVKEALDNRDLVRQGEAARLGGDPRVKLAENTQMTYGGREVALTLYSNTPFRNDDHAPWGSSTRWLESQFRSLMWSVGMKHAPIAARAVARTMDEAQAKAIADRLSAVVESGKSGVEVWSDKASSPQFLAGIVDSISVTECDLGGYEVLVQLGAASAGYDSYNSPAKVEKGIRDLLAEPEMVGVPVRVRSFPERHYGAVSYRFGMMIRDDEQAKIAAYRKQGPEAWKEDIVAFSDKQDLRLLRAVGPALEPLAAQLEAFTALEGEAKTARAAELWQSLKGFLLGEGAADAGWLSQVNHLSHADQAAYLEATIKFLTRSPAYADKISRADWIGMLDAQALFERCVARLDLMQAYVDNQTMDEAHLRHTRELIAKLAAGPQASFTAALEGIVGKS